jgi:7-cyano-7-deazaguanine synthase
MRDVKTALLLSGGMDSLAIAWWKRPDVAITVDYGQLPAAAEIAASASICGRLAIPHHVLRIDCRTLGSGDMAGIAANVHAPAQDWWPFRNQMLVTFAAMKAISMDVSRLLLGAVRSDHVHRDGTQQFIFAMSALLSLQEGGLALEAPAIEFSTRELVERSGVPPDILAWGHSCHRADVACGSCRGCNKMFENLSALGYELD